ncbi:unnamed protein product [Adineta ricciae]|uniref:Reverse transcriptase domain-containing protein n=1 Tax=Adineta ricciae TaxID=249248 RepID=A0A815R268_ADIRI|nr:unnamed protein product [Adineta ricciae]
MRVYGNYRAVAIVDRNEAISDCAEEGNGTLGISELKWAGNGYFTSGSYEVYYSGSQNTWIDGVAIVLNRKLVNSVTGYFPKNSRIISIRLQEQPTNLTIIQIYTPATEANESTIDSFCMDLQQTLDNTPKKDAILITGHWIAKKTVCSSPIYAFNNQNDDYTWTTPNGQHRNQIDYILYNGRWKASITSIKTRPGADRVTDHELLVADFRAMLKQYYKPTLTAKFDALNLVYKDLEELWQEIRGTVNDEMQRNIPAVPRKKKNNWLSSSTLAIAKERREAKTIQRRLEPFPERELSVTQAGFRKGRGTRDQIANLRSRKALAGTIGNGCAKAFDHSHEELIYQPTSNGEIQTMEIPTSSTLEKVKSEIYETASGIKIGGRNINNIRYADDTTILAETADDLQYLIQKVKKSAATGVKLNMKKNFVMTNGSIQELYIDNDQMEIIKEFIFWALL